MNRRLSHAARTSALTAAAALLLLAGACHRYGPIPLEVPDARPPDALLTDPELQHLVELQVRREGAALAAELSSPRSAVRARAAFALGSVQDPVAVPALIRLLSDTSAAVRRDAAFALGQAGDTLALAPMVKAYGTEKDPEVRHRLLEAMGKLPAVRGPAALLGLDVPPDEEADRALALARLGAVRGIITEDALVWLLGHLKSPDPAVRKNAAYFIGRVRTSAPWTDRAGIVRDALESYRKDDPAGMYLITGLGRQADRRNAEPIAEWATHSPDWRMRANAMAAMGPWAPRDGRESGESREEREEEEKMGDVPMKGLDDPSIHVAVSAAQTISQRPPTPSDVSEVEAWIDAHPDRWQVAAPLLVFLARADKREYVFHWLDGLSADDEARWGIGLQALAFTRGQEALDRLTGALQSGSGPVAADAAVALVGRWRAERSRQNAAAMYFPLFSAALRKGSPRVTFTVAPLLADSVFLGLGSADTLVAAYRRMSAQDDVEAMLAVLSALTSTGDRAAEPLMRDALASRHPAIRREAASDLARLTGDTANVASDTGPSPTSQDTAAGAILDAAKLDWGYLAQLGVAPRLVLDTNRGRVVVRMDTDEAPQTVQTIARLAEAGKYDGVPFHRVVPNFVIQGGDFTNRDGSGGPGFTIDSELTLIPFLRGVIGMARSPQKDTEGSQFFITHSMQPHLDGAYTSFGWVVEGMDVVDRIAQGDTLVHASIERGG